jgi:DNA-binding NtrC family response regulator
LLNRNDVSTYLDGRPHVMVVDDDPNMCDFLESFLAVRGYQAVTVGSADEAVRRYQADRPAAVILDVMMPGTMDGLEALAAFKRIDRDVPVIMLSGHGLTATVVQAMKLGAQDFVSKPFADADLDAPLTHALRQPRHEAPTRPDPTPVASKHDMIFGRGDRMLEVQSLIERVAVTDVTVMIRGESGTGKESVARALCAASLRRDQPFVKVHCAGVPDELLDAELFGFIRGHRTVEHEPGKFELANHGTLLLDEIGELSVALQAKLVHVLQDGEFWSFGARRDVDIRIIAATTRDLDQAVASGQFREDLFGRLSIVSINMPPLRERLDDLPSLVGYFLKQYAVRYNKPGVDVSPDTLGLLADYDWPGNIRELENLIKRAVVLGTEAPLRQIRLQSSMVSRAPSPGNRQTPAEIAGAAADAGNCSLKEVSRTAAREAERELIFRVLQQTRWNRKETAEILKISYKALLYKIKENGLDKAS